MSAQYFTHVVVYDTERGRRTHALFKGKHVGCILV